LVSWLYPNEANKPLYRQLFICDSTEVKTKLPENQSNQGFMAEIMAGLGEMLRQVNPFDGTYMNECIKVKVR
jgi:hypothetical protein